MSDSRQARRAKTRKAAREEKKLTTPGLDALVALGKTDVAFQLARAAKNGLKGSEWLVLLCSDDSAIAKQMGMASKDGVGRVFTAIAAKTTVAASVAKIMQPPSRGEILSMEILAEAECDHLWVLLATSSTGRYCCATCDLKIEVPS